MKKLTMKKRLTVGGVLIFTGLTAAMMMSCASHDSANAGQTQPKNVIFMVPDGMGLSNVTTSRIYKNGPNGDSLNFEKLPYIGYQRTHSLNSTVTDSAAAASAWASGEKFNNGEISCLDNDNDGVCDETRINSQTILEVAQEMGMGTGLVATSDITHATPAVFGAHVHNRKCESEIFSQFIKHGIDVLMGGGVATNRSSCLLGATDDAFNAALIEQAQSNGYAYVNYKSELDAVGTPEKLLGLFHDGGLTPIYQRSADSVEPTLADMTHAALNILEQKPNGFFLMVEGSQIDWADHARNVAYMVQEVLDFDDSVKIVWDWINETEERKKNTLLVVVADHETGGVIIDGPYGSLSQNGGTASQLVLPSGTAVTDQDGNPVMAPDVSVVFGSNHENPTQSAGHTAVDTIIRSNSPQCAKAMDNTELYQIMMDFML
ncbi:MAG: alkaline phosphatase [Desulfobacterium sp.]|nr:alkaline phosphatase [Desulfobacterium sp.]